MVSILPILKRMNESGVPYVLIGGLAARAHGSSVNTDDIDVCVEPIDEHWRRIVAAFSDVRPYYRMRPDKPPLTPDHPWLVGLKNLYLRTDIGQLDILGEVPGVGSYGDIKDKTISADLQGLQCRVLDIPTLIRAKQQANRPKDQQAIRELQIIWQRIQQRGQ